MSQREILTNGSAFKRTDGRWCGVVWYKDEHGERKRKSFSGTTKSEVNKKMKKYIVEFNEDIVYVYNHNVSASKMMRAMWGLRDEDEIWYACYGSNLSEERFRCYIEGGKYEQNGVTYLGCSDKTTWSDEAMSAFEGELYFGNKSGSWNGKGVAFYDPEVNGVTFMRLYKIKFSQFRDLRRMEGASPNWYGRIVCLGVKDNTPIYTLTSEARRPANTPCRAYLKLLANAMRNELELTDEAVLNLIINAVTA